MDGRARPLSRRATTGCVVPIFRANSSCVRPARFLTSITVDARTNSSSSASQAFRYLALSFHPLPVHVRYACHGATSIIELISHETSQIAPQNSTPARQPHLPSHRRPSACLACGSPTRSSPMSSMSFAMRASRTRMSSGKASTSASTVSFRVSTTQPMSQYIKKDMFWSPD